MINRFSEEILTELVVDGGRIYDQRSAINFFVETRLSTGCVDINVALILSVALTLLKYPTEAAHRKTKLI